MTDEPINDRIYAEKLKQVYGNFTLPVLGNFLAAVLLILLQMHVIPLSQLLIWFLLLTIITLYRNNLANRFIKTCGDSISACLEWKNRLIFGTLMAGLVWAGGIAVTFPENNLPFQVTLSMVVAGLGAGATSTIAIVFSSYICFIFPMVIVYIALLVWEFNQTTLIVAVSMVMLLVFVSRAALSMADNAESNIRLLIEAEQRENDLELARNQALQGQKVKAEFLANMSHEIRTPMNAILGMTHLTLKGELDDRQRNYINKVHVSAHGLLRILNDILDYSKFEAGKLDLEVYPFKLSDILSKMLNLVRLMAEEKNIKLQVKVDRDVPQVMAGDPLRLEQVLTNLVNNAIKFSHRDGQVALSVRSEYVKEGKVVLYFKVKDFGIGLSEEQQQRLFQPFSQADSSTTRQFGGSGLGLAICRQLTELMGGEIGVDSTLGEGSEFFFTVRMTAQKEINDPQFRIETRSEVNKIDDALWNKKVLLVEDDAINQELTNDLLVEEGILVSVARHGEDALKKLNEERFDLILMDCQMPVMDGYEATRIIRADERFHDLPIIAFTASAFKQDIKKVLEAGMNDHIAKPIDPQQLYRTLSYWIGEKT